MTTKDEIELLILRHAQGDESTKNTVKGILSLFDVIERKLDDLTPNEIKAFDQKHREFSLQGRPFKGEELVEYIKTFREPSVR